MTQFTSQNQETNKFTNEGQESNGNGESKRTSKRGFAAMDREKQKQIASEGGKAAHRQGVAHRWTSVEASVAGIKGGQNSRGSRQSSPQP